jgi:Zn ribbon nucleic-acid-binding protein
MLDFCPMCKSILQLKEENNKQIGVCNCGFKRTGGISLAEDEINIIVNSGSGVVSENLTGEGFEMVCKKCGYDRADASSIISNESEITIFTCLKCGARNRQSSGGSKA